MNDMYSIDRAFEILRDCFRSGGKLLLCGNGGSAADCDHIVAELVKGMTKQTAGLPAISLCAHTGLITAIANDIGADSIFSQQVLGYGQEGDTLLAISTSGKSSNVLNALKTAMHNGLRTIGLTGTNPGEFRKYCNVIIACPGSNTAEIQEQHIKVYHELCRRLEEEFYP